MKKILVVDDMAICREPIAEALRSHGYGVVCAASGEEALVLLRQQAPDVMLLDMAMPGADGMDVLRCIRSDHRWQSLPVIVLTDQAGRGSVASAASYNIQGYLLKSGFSLAALIQRIEACCAQRAKTPIHAVTRKDLQEQPVEPGIAVEQGAATLTLPRFRPERTNAVPGLPRSPEAATSVNDLKPIISKGELIRLVTEGLKLRPLGPAVHNVIVAASAADCTFEDVAKAVSHDQVLAIRLLKLANSSAYSRGRPVESVRDAVQRVGISEVRRLVMALGVLERYEQADSTRLDSRSFWEHSIACGLIAAAIAKSRKAANPDEYFLWGMLHDIGRLIMVEHTPEAYAQVCKAAAQFALPLEALEAKLMLTDHCEILRSALEHWQFPRDFIPPVVNHHRSVTTMRRLGSRHSEAAATIALADRLAHALLLGSSGNDAIYPFEDLAEFLSLSGQAIAEIAAKALDETRGLKLSLLAKVDDPTWPDAVACLRERIRCPLHPIYITASPVADGFRLFLDRVALDTEGPPNIAIIYLRRAEELSPLIAKLETAERESGSQDTPIMLISLQQRIEANQALLQRRRSCLLGLPVRVDTFLLRANELLPT